MPSKPSSPSMIPVERIARSIYLIRQEKVMLDSDLAGLYEVPIARLNEQVKRNLNRFPREFAVPLSQDEFDSLISQFATSKTGRRGRGKLPWTFTEKE